MHSVIELSSTWDAHSFVAAAPNCFGTVSETWNSGRDGTGARPRPALLSCNARGQQPALNAIRSPAYTLRVSIIAAGTHEVTHVMRYAAQIESRFEQMGLPISGEPDEFRRFVAGYPKTCPLTAPDSVLDRQFIIYVSGLTGGVTGGVIDLLCRAALHALTMRSKRSRLEVLQHACARLPIIIG